MTRTSVAEVLRAVAARLAAAGVEAPRREARLLVEAATGLPRHADPATAIDAAAVEQLVARRVAREPLAFITGRRGFWSLELAVSAATLIPRPETETLIEAAVALCPDRSAVSRVLDLGTGSGALLLAALAEFGRAFGVGIDRVEAAVGLAARNTASCGMAGRAGFAVGEWAAPAGDRTFDLVLCNPPYIESAAVPGLAPEVARYEPRSALDGGADGLAAYRALLPGLRRVLAEGGVAVLELGLGQEAAVVALAAEAGLTHIGTRPDLAGIPRALALKRWS
jgi:release factor glutamine methyltransferase